MGVSWRGEREVLAFTHAEMRTQAKELRLGAYTRAVPKIVE